MNKFMYGGYRNIKKYPLLLPLHYHNKEKN